MHWSYCSLALSHWYRKVKWDFSYIAIYQHIEGWWWLPFGQGLKTRQNGCRCEDDVFKCIFLNENVWIRIKISLKFVPKGPINNIPALVQIMAWRRPGDKPLSEAMMVSLLTHICVTRPQCVKKAFESEELVETLLMPSDIGMSIYCNWSLPAWHNEG